MVDPLSYIGLPALISSCTIKLACHSEFTLVGNKTVPAIQFLICIRIAAAEQFIILRRSAVIDRVLSECFDRIHQCHILCAHSFSLKINLPPPEEYQSYTISEHHTSELRI